MDSTITEENVARARARDAITDLEKAIVARCRAEIEAAVLTEREACAQAIEDESQEHPGAEVHYSIACGVVRARWG